MTTDLRAATPRLGETTGAERRPWGTNPLVFVFGGQGTQYRGMGRYHFDHDEVFRESALAMERVLIDQGHGGVLDEIMSRPPGAPFAMEDLRLSHPGIAIVQLALADSLRARGVRPDVVVGSSLGELVALSVAGAIDREWLLRALVEQIRSLERHRPAGGLLVVLENHAIFSEDPARWAPLELAGISASRHFVVAGPPDALDARARALRSEGITAEAAPVPYPFHSSYIDVIRDDFVTSLARTPLRRPDIPVVSAVTGRQITDVTAEHLWRVAREPFLWQDVAFHIEADGSARYVDLSPSGSMSGYLRMDFGRRLAGRIVALTGPLCPQEPVSARVAEIGVKARPLGETVTLPTAATHDLPSAAEPSAPARVALVFPGQGSQHVGMGADLFDRFPALVREADEILGYSIRTLCLEDPDRTLSQTQFTQPALFVVGALAYEAFLADEGEPTDLVLAGHSLGEFTALYAAGALTFGDALRLVAERGRLMSHVEGGAMGAVLGLGEAEIRDRLQRAGEDSVDIANLNGPTQTVLSGRAEDVDRCGALFTGDGVRFVRLKVSGAFHSRYMAAVADEFRAALDRTPFATPRHTVIANATAQPYAGDPRDLLARQLVSPVRWLDTVGWFLDRDLTVRELGPGVVLTRLASSIAAAWTVRPTPWPAAEEPAREPSAAQTTDTGDTPGTRLGSAVFRRTHGLTYAYVCGGMYRGIASPDLVIDAARAGVLSFLGSGGLTTEAVRSAIAEVRAAGGLRAPFGVDVVHDVYDDTPQAELVSLLVEQGVTHVEASAFVRVTPALVRYVGAGLARAADGGVERRTHLLAKVSRPEVAREFLASAPSEIVAGLVRDGLLTAEQAELLRSVPVADDLCVEGDSGGHTDRRNPLVLFPALQREAQRAATDFGYAAHLATRVGLAGGIGAPEAAAAAFAMGADFVLTGSINLCTAESGISEAAKDILVGLDIQDTDYAPAGDMFELGSQVQVVRRGIFFPARARKLHELYRRYDSLADLDEDTRTLLETRYFRRSLEEVWEDTRAYFATRDPAQIARAEQDDHHKMALVFRSYFGRSQRAALDGTPGLKLDYQIQCGPALGAFNSWVRDTPRASWRNRHVGEIAAALMEEAAARLDELAAGR